MKKTLMLAVTILATAAMSVSMSAQEVIVTPTNAPALGWSTADTRPGGTVEITGERPFAGNGSLNLTTDTPAAKAQYLHEANTPFSDLTALSYSTFQDSASFAGGDASYQLIACLGGFDPDAVTSTNPTGCVGFTTLVFEPYQNGTVLPGVWQDWDVDAGQFWSSRSYSSGSCAVVAGGGGAPFYTLSSLTTACPDAVAVGFGVNIGTNNPAYDVFADLVNFNGTTYNFELFEEAANANQCKNGGWRFVTRGDGSPFKNQGDCVSYTRNGK